MCFLRGIENMLFMGPLVADGYWKIHIGLGFRPPGALIAFWTDSTRGVCCESGASVGIVE